MASRGERFIEGSHRLKEVAPGLEILARSLVRAALVVDPGDPEKTAAVDRASMNIRTSRRGGGISDCLIFETALSVCSHLNAVGDAGRRVFVSSNAKDYGDPATPDELRAELESAAMKYVSNLSWALHEAGLA
jgi:hypothetical protein